MMWRCLFHLIVTAVVFFGTSLLGNDAPSAKLPVPLRPLEVSLSVACRPSPTLTPEMQRAWMAELQSQLSSWQSGSWNVAVEPASSWTEPEELAALARYVSAPDWVLPQADKTVRVLLDDRSGELSLTLREWDRCSRSLGPVQSALVVDRRDVVSTLAQLVLQSIRPLVEISVVDGPHIEGDIQAGEFPSRLDESVDLQPGDLLVPFLRVFDRKRELRTVQLIPWTTLKVTAVDRARVQLEQISTFQKPFPASRRRIEIWALRERPDLSATEVMIFPRGRKQNPLAGARCEVVSPPAGNAETKDYVLKLSTDREGVVRVPVDPERPVRTLQVYSGEALLARVPLVPGLERRLELEVPDDRARLHVEGEVHLLDAELLDIVATREVLCARLRALAGQERWSDVDQLLGDLDRLPTLSVFQARVESLKTQGVFAAQQAKDKVAQVRIERLCDQVQVSAKKYLDPARIDDLKASIAADRKNPPPAGKQ